MKNRYKFVTTLILLLIILLAMCLGIYAMVTSKGEIDGTVTYYANYVSADIYGRIDGYDKSGGTLKEFNDEISPSAPSGVSKVWDIGAVNFSRDKNDWSYGIKDDGEGNLIEDDLIVPTLTIRLAITNRAEYQENIGKRLRLYIGNIVAPEEASNLVYSYRKGYGVLYGENQEFSWTTPFSTLQSLEYFNVDEKESLNPLDASLNDKENGKFLECKKGVVEGKENENLLYSVYILEFKIRVKDPSKDVNNFNVKLSLNLSSSEIK